MQYTFTMHEEDAWLRNGPVSTGGQVIGYRVGGMPDGKTARIANFGAPNRNDFLRVPSERTPLLLYRLSHPRCVNTIPENSVLCFSGALTPAVPVLTYHYPE
jgi:hypothetical protein